MKKLLLVVLLTVSAYAQQHGPITYTYTGVLPVLGSPVFSWSVRTNKFLNQPTVFTSYATQNLPSGCSLQYVRIVTYPNQPQYEVDIQFNGLGCQGVALIEDVAGAGGPINKVGTYVFDTSAVIQVSKQGSK